MVAYALLCTGQGAQSVGMGKGFYDAFNVARDAYRDANRILGFDVAALCFEGDSAELTRTDKCQPAIYTTTMAVWRVVQTKTNWGKPAILAGLSLGEYAALTIAGAWNFEDGLRLVQLRGAAMEEASQHTPGTMSAVFGLSREAVDALCRESGAEVANINSPGQIVISGAVDTIAKAETLAKTAGAKRVLRLEVSGAFHSSLMRRAAQQMEQALSRLDIRPLSMPCISNVTAQPVLDPSTIRANLVKQLTSPTLWVDSMQRLADQKMTQCVELAPGKVLAGLLKRIAPAIPCVSVNEPSDLAQLETVATT